MSSENYAIQQDVISLGGGYSTSTSYQAWDTLGEMATGEDMTSENYGGCSGFQCELEASFLSFSVASGTSRPGTSGGGVPLGTLTTSEVVTSDGASINSIFLTADSGASGGLVVTVQNSADGLESLSNPGTTIDSSTATLAAGTEGFGLCVFSTTQTDGSPTNFTAASPYDGTCTKSTGHDVGVTDTTSRSIVTSSGELWGGDAEILVKAAIGPTTAGVSDYSGTLTFIATATY